MHHDQNRENQKRKLSKNRRLNETSGGFIHFWELGETCNMHHWLMGMDAPVEMYILQHAKAFISTLYSINVADWTATKISILLRSGSATKYPAIAIYY